MLAHAAAVNPDPNFALIEAAKRATAAFEGACEIEVRLDDEVGLESLSQYKRPDSWAETKM